MGRIDPDTADITTADTVPADLIPAAGVTADHIAAGITDPPGTIAVRSLHGDITQTTITATLIAAIRIAAIRIAAIRTAPSTTPVRRVAGRAVLPVAAADMGLQATTPRRGRHIMAADRTPLADAVQAAWLSILSLDS